MSLLTRIKRILGLERSAEWEDEQPAAVTVEHEPEEEPDEATDDDERTVEADVDETPPEEPPAPEPEPADDDAEPGEPVTSLDGIGPTYGDRLAEAGVDSVDDLAAADPASLAEATDIAESRLVRWVESAEQRTSG